ncbi:MAG: FecR domain-containing protein [Planctomycetes bacterium]|nr:FecR domain-containing protein [Planctomycetota bacterium]
MRTLVAILASLALVAAAAGAPAADTPAAPGPAPTAPATAAPAPAPAKPAAETKPAAGAPAAEAKTPEKLIAVVKSVEGTVETRPAVGQPWVPVKPGDQLAEGADLRTGFRARCVLDMNKNTVQVDPLAVVRIGELRKEGDTVRTRILLKQGSTDANVERGGPKNDFAIVTPTATLSVRGTHGVHADFFHGFGGNYGLTGDGLTFLMNNSTGQHTGMGPGQNSNDNAAPPFYTQQQNFLPTNIDPHAFEPNEQNANGRWHTSMPAPPALGGSSGSPVLNPTQQANEQQPPPPRPKDDYGGYDYGPPR